MGDEGRLLETMVLVDIAIVVTVALALFGPLADSLLRLINGHRFPSGWKITSYCCIFLAFLVSIHTWPQFNTGSPVRLVGGLIFFVVSFGCAMVMAVWCAATYHEAEDEEWFDIKLDDYTPPGRWLVSRPFDWDEEEPLF